MPSNTHYTLHIGASHGVSLGFIFHARNWLYTDKVKVCGSALNWMHFDNPEALELVLNWLYFDNTEALESLQNWLYFDNHEALELLLNWLCFDNPEALESVLNWLYFDNVEALESVLNWLYFDNAEALELVLNWLYFDNLKTLESVLNWLYFDNPKALESMLNWLYYDNVEALESVPNCLHFHNPKALESFLNLLYFVNPKALESDLNWLYFDNIEAPESVLFGISYKTIFRINLITSIIIIQTWYRHEHINPWSKRYWWIDNLPVSPNYSLFHGCNMLQILHMSYNMFMLPCYHSLTLISAWISNHMSYTVWDEITYPFPNFNGVTVGVWEWMSNFIPHFIMGVITNPYWSAYIMIVWECCKIFCAVRMYQRLKAKLWLTPPDLL